MGALLRPRSFSPPRVLAIHGGPGMSFGYLDDAVAELAAQYQVATYQQRGLVPSTEHGGSRSPRPWPTSWPYWMAWAGTRPT